MSVLGVRCEKEAIAYVLLDGVPESPTLLEHDRVNMRGSSRPEQLQWLRKEIRELVTRTGAEVLAFKAPETNARSKDLGRAECEGVLQEATLSKGLVPLKRVKRQIRADLGFQESARYLHKALPESLSGLPKNREEAALAALSGLAHA
jgi:hypothetical protein